MTTTIDQIKTDVQNAPSLYGRPIAVLHQAVTPPSLNGAVKPSNPFRVPGFIRRHRERTGPGRL
jgi:hypothetical protein